MNRKEIAATLALDDRTTFALAHYRRAKGIDAPCSNEVRLPNGAQPAARKIRGGWRDRLEDKPTGIEVEYVANVGTGMHGIAAGDRRVVQLADIVATWSDYEARRQQVAAHQAEAQDELEQARRRANRAAVGLSAYLPDSLADSVLVTHTEARADRGFCIELSLEAAEELARRLAEEPMGGGVEPCTVPGCGGWA